jgi:hypothetical protein
MGWSTLVLGSFEFLLSVDPIQCSTILNQAHEIFECEPTPDKENPLSYHVEKLEWNGHVLQDKINAFFIEFGACFNYYSLSFWDLEQPTADWYKEN